MDSKTKLTDQLQSSLEHVDEVQAVLYDRSIWEQLEEIMAALEAVVPALEFDGTNLRYDTAVAIANFPVKRDGRPVRLSFKIHDKRDEMWIGFTISRSYVTHHYGYWCGSGIISYYGGRERRIGSQRHYPPIKKPVLGKGERDSGYGSIQLPGVAKHMLQPYSKGDEIELELHLGMGNKNGDWISLYHNKEPQVIKENIGNFTRGVDKLFPFVVIDIPEDDVEMQLVL